MNDYKKSFKQFIDDTAKLTNDLKHLFNEMPPEERKKPLYKNAIFAQIRSVFLNYEKTFNKEAMIKQNIKQTEINMENQMKQNEQIIKHSLKELDGPEPLRIKAKETPKNKG